MGHQVTTDHSQRAHARLSASGASRWMSCPPSVGMEEGFPDTESVFAMEGTLAHELADVSLAHLLGRVQVQLLKAEVARIKAHELYSEEMPEEVDKYVQFVLSQFQEAKRRTSDAKLLIEHKIDLTHYIENGFGTSDAVIIADGVLEVHDLKYGKGVRVEAERNPQAMLYGLGVLRAMGLLYDIRTVRLGIIQPRLDHISVWDISADELLTWGEDIVKPVAAKAYAGEGELNPGSHCRFCKAKSRCRALAEQNLAVARHEFADPKLLSDDELLAVYAQQGQISDWVNAVADYLLAEALGGKQWAGHKLVEGRSIRKWADEDRAALALAAEKFTEEQIFNKKLKGIGDVEKLTGKAKFGPLLDTYIVKPPGKPTLVPDSDKRTALANSAHTDFQT